jgi:hypothetical protein
LTAAKSSAARVEREDVLLGFFAFTPVLAWFAAQMLSLLATCCICATGHRWLLYLVTGSALAAALSAGVASWTKWNSLADTPTHRRFMAVGGVLLAAICAVSILSLMIPAAVHRPCD